MMQAFSQASIDEPPLLADREQFPPLVPGMSTYESQDVDMDVETPPGGVSFSTNAAHFETFSQTSDAGAESEGSARSY